MSGGDPGNLEVTLREMLTDREQPRLQEATQMALSDRGAMSQILAGIVAKDEVYRYNCFQLLYRLSEEQPEALYAEWDYIAGLLDSNNSYHRSIAGQLLANLTRADTEGRFETIFDRTFALLDDDKIVPARQFAQHVGRIARAKPDLQARITERLLAVDGTHHTESRKDLLKGDVIAALDEFFSESPEQARILDFARRQLACSSPRTRKAAQAFLKSHGRQG
jgi:hypothetical protein